MLFDRCISQVLDLSGKARILNFDRVSLAVSPLPPLDKREVAQTDSILATIEDAIDFIENTDLIITEQDIISPKSTLESEDSRSIFSLSSKEDVDHLIKGLWVKSKSNPPAIIYGYIPLLDSRVLKDIPFSHEAMVPPVLVETITRSKKSKFKEFLRHKKIALFLSEYSLYEMSIDVDNFGMGNYTIISNYYYDLEIVTYELPPKKSSNPFYSGESMVVPDEETAIRLIKYAQTRSIRDSFLIENYINKTRIDNSQFFSSISDFKSEKNQLVFLNKASLIAWKNSITQKTYTKDVYFLKDKDEMYVSVNPSPYKTEPYYYRNNNIQDGRLMILQNTSTGDIISALTVSKEWEITGTNIGYSPESLLTTTSSLEESAFEVYTEEGLTHISKKSKYVMKLFGYNDGSYAAILFL